MKSSQSPAVSDLSTDMPEVRDYQALLSRVFQEFQSGIVQAQRMLEYARLSTYWNIGKIIREEADSSGPKALTDAFYQRFSQDLIEQGMDMSDDLLKRSVQFQKNYPAFPQNTPLTFTHFLSLMRVEDEKERLRLEQKAVKQGWTTYDLRKEIRALKKKGAVVLVSGGKLVYERGIPYTYQICQVTDMKNQKILAIDCGFNLCRDLPDTVTQKMESGVTVTSHKNGTEYVLTRNNKRRGMHYTYPARVLKVVDGDTLDLFIDPGFEEKMKDERVRLRGIDAPEMSAPGGPEAKEFLFNYLAACPVIVVRTTKASGESAGDAREKFGRWLVDIFALPGCDDVMRIAEEGTYVNQLMLDEGLAGIYK